MAVSEYPTRRLFTNAEYQLAQRAWDREGMEDPTVGLPIADEPEESGPEDTAAELMFPPSFCQCGAMSIRGIGVDEMTREWVAMDRKDHHLGRPCGTKLWSM